MEFETKRQLLQYLGKNENDNKLVDRLILRGEVVKENGMYVLINKDEIIADLRKRVSELEGKLTLSQQSNGDYEEAKEQRDYYQGLARYNKLLLNKVLEIAYRKVKGTPGVKMMESEDDFIEGIMESAKEIVGEFEE